MSGKIVFGGFSIGDYKDIPVRVLEMMDTADIVAIEWSAIFEKHFRLMNKYPKAKVIEYNPMLPNADEIAKELINEAKNGKTILLLVCEGMPSVSDPGLELSRMAREEGILVTCIPGPSAILAALSVSGIDSNRFLLEPEVFEFKEERIRNFNTVKDFMQTLIYIVNRNSEAARYKDGKLNENFLVETLEDMVDIFGPDRPAALCFNLTMIDELVIRKSLSDCLSWAKDNKNNGYLTIVIEGYRYYE